MHRRALPALAFSICALAACSDSEPSDDACEGEACVDTDLDAADATDAESDADAPDGRVIPDVATDVADGSGDTGADAEVGDTTEDADADVEVTYPPLSFVTDPAQDDTFVPLDVTVSVRFNQPMNSFRLIASNLSFRPEGGENIPRTIEYDPETYELTLSAPEDAPPLRPVSPYEFRMAEEIGSVSGETLGEPFRLTFSTTGYEGRVFLRQLAEAYAPVVYQQVETPEIDTFTRIDFDGDDDPANNLEAANEANYGYAYFDVIETTTHWYITYLYYYPGSIPREGVLYEHDIASVQVVVQKDDEDPLGTLRAFTTFYRETINLWTVETGWYADGMVPQNGTESVDGRLRVSDLEDGRHVSIFLESGRHTVCLLNESTTIPSCAPQGGETAPFDPDATGLVYRVGEAGQRQGDAADDALTYSLRSFVEEFWALRNRTDGDDAVFGGSFEYEPPLVAEGTDDDEPVYRPGVGEVFPTALNSDDDNGSFGELPFVHNPTRERRDRGIWYADPAWSTSIVWEMPEEVSLEYCLNPYLNIDVRDENEACTPTSFRIE